MQGATFKSKLGQLEINPFRLDQPRDPLNMVFTYRRESIHTTHNKPGQRATNAAATCARQQHKYQQQQCQDTLKDAPPSSNPTPLLHDPRGSQYTQTVRPCGVPPFESDSRYPENHHGHHTAANASWNATSASGCLPLQSIGAAACEAQASKAARARQQAHVQRQASCGAHATPRAVKVTQVDLNLTIHLRSTLRKRLSPPILNLKALQ